VPHPLLRSSFFFLGFAAKGGIKITVYAQEIALISRSWRCGGKTIESHPSPKPKPRRMGHPFVSLRRQRAGHRPTDFWKIDFDIKLA
jgi:hypothetical protein